MNAVVAVASSRLRASCDRAQVDYEVCGQPLSTLADSWSGKAPSVQICNAWTRSDLEESMCNLRVLV